MVDAPTATGLTWGAGVRALRQLKNLSQAELAAKASTTQATISRIENGARGVSDSLKMRIALNLDTHPHRLFPAGADQ